MKKYAQCITAVFHVPVKKHNMSQKSVQVQLLKFKIVLRNKEF